MMKVITSIDEFQSLTGQEKNSVSATGWKSHQPMIDSFAVTTGDRQWIHIDPERARRGSRPSAPRSLMGF